jgi:hypothetical protein
MPFFNKKVPNQLCEKMLVLCLLITQGEDATVEGSLHVASGGGAAVGDGFTDGIEVTQS